jgi:U2 small nuclear ribonucleoprotein A'
VEREKSKSLFGTEEEPSELALKIMGIKSRTFDVGAASTTNGSAAPTEKSMRVILTETEKKRLAKLVREAKSLQEIARLEKEVNEGRIPAGAADEDRMMM